MKIKMVALIGFLTSCAVSALAADKLELDNRIQTLNAKLTALEQQPDKMVPPEILRQARGIVLLDRTKAGFLFAYEGGAGVALARDPKTDRWGPAAFVKANEASLGFQVGAEQNFFVILLMNTNANRYLTEPNFEFGGEARGTAGDTTAGAGGTVSTRERPILVYDNRVGLYGGAALKGGSISPDEEANHAYYDRFVTMQDILFDRTVQTSDADRALIATLDAYSRPRATAQR